MVKHIELTDDHMSGVASAELERCGWVISEKDGKIVYNRPGAFGSGNLCWQDAVKIQESIDRWGMIDRAKINAALGGSK